MALEHEQLSLEDSLIAEGKVHSHLVTVEVSVEGGTCQRVQLNGLTLDEFHSLSVFRNGAR